MNKRNKLVYHFFQKAEIKPETVGTLRIQINTSNQLPSYKRREKKKQTRQKPVPAPEKADAKNLPVSHSPDEEGDGSGCVRRYSIATSTRLVSVALSAVTTCSRPKPISMSCVIVLSSGTNGTPAPAGSRYQTTRVEK